MMTPAAEALGHATKLLHTGDHTAAGPALEAVLASLGDLTGMARDAVSKAKAMLGPLLAQLADEEKEDPPQGAFVEPWDLMKLALRLDPQNEEAAEGIQDMSYVMDESRKRDSEEADSEGKQQQESPSLHAPNHAEPHDVIIVGAGASGIGLGLLLTKTFGLDSERVLLLERGEAVAESFRRWPKEMRFISPSFNQQGWTNSFDLNSVAHGTSPAYSLAAEHPTGEQYASYLSALASENGLNVRTGTEVTAVGPYPEGNGFSVEVTPTGKKAPQTLRCRYVVWAAGEFQYPKTSGLFPGAEHCLHNSSVRSWAELPGDEFVVIGGYESGMDAASNLAMNKKRCTVVSSTAHWSVVDQDPSVELAPYTAHRILTAKASQTPPQLLAPFRVSAVEKLDGKKGYIVRAKRGEKEEGEGHKLRVTADGDVEASKADSLSLCTPQPPLLCCGFSGSIAMGAAKGLFEFGVEDGEGGCEAGAPKLTGKDESTTTPGLFLCGPSVRHGKLSFCFVYKFRQRFGIVADAIAEGLGFDTEEAVQECKKMNMFLDDLSCCESACGETC